MRRILVPTDFSEPSRQALGYALGLAAVVEGDLLLLHVVEKDPCCRYIVGEPADPHPPWVDSTGHLFQWDPSPTIIYHDRCEEARWKLANLLPPGYPERFRPLVTRRQGWRGNRQSRPGEEGRFDPPGGPPPPTLAPFRVAQCAGSNPAPDASSSYGVLRRRWGLFSAGEEA
jgi:Universal stress protein family